MLVTRIISAIVVILTIVVPIGYYFLVGRKHNVNRAGTLAVNIATFAAAFVISTIVVFAQTAKAAPETSASGLGYIAAGLAVGLACIGSGLAVASSASAALGAISEDSTIFGKSLVFVGLSEGIALYGLIISFMILGAL